MRGNTADLTFKQRERISTRERGTEEEAEGERRICCETSLVGYAFSCMRISVRKKTWSLWMLTRYMRFAPSMLHPRQIYFEHRGCIYGDKSLDVDDLLNFINIDVTFSDKDRYQTVVVQTFARSRLGNAAIYRDTISPRKRTILYVQRTKRFNIVRAGEGGWGEVGDRRYERLSRIRSQAIRITFLSDLLRQ